MSLPNNIEKICKNYRKELFEKFLEVGQGHPGSVFSLVEIVTTLFHKSFIRFDKSKHLFKDKIIISKGHATVSLYPILRDYGVIKKEDWENWGQKDKTSNLRVFGNTSIPGIDATTGSLGHGLGIACGMAYLYKKQEIDKKVYVVISEGELYEGSTWEALLFAAHHNLDNLNVIIDENSLIILGNTSDCLRLDPIIDKIKGFGFDVSQIDGHNINEIENALSKKKNQTNIILAKTIKGKGFSIMENKANWHYWNNLEPDEIEICRKDIL